MQSHSAWFGVGGSWKSLLNRLTVTQENKAYRSASQPFTTQTGARRKCGRRGRTLGWGSNEFNGTELSSEVREVIRGRNRVAIDGDHPETLVVICREVGEGDTSRVDRGHFRAKERWYFSPCSWGNSVAAIFREVGSDR
jgi:hypothetical protein